VNWSESRPMDPDLGLQGQPSAAWPTSEDRIWSVACHLAAFLGAVVPFPGASIVGPLVVWLCRRDESVFVDEQGRRALNFQITMAILYLATLPLVLVLIGIPLLGAVAVMNGVFSVWAAVRVASGHDHRYPFTMELVAPRRR